MIDNSIIKIIKDKNIEKKFYKTLKKIHNLSKRHKIYMAIDFEFNTKKIALMQILFEIHIKNRIVKRYYIIYPPNLEQNTYDYFKNNIMSNLNILKILHGSESLDVPYIIDDFYNHDINSSIDFFMSMIDTKYLCEYMNIVQKKPNICKIYDLLVNLKIITEEEKKTLDINEERMGEIFNIYIDINDLSQELITYAIHDVVYLIDLYNVLKNLMIKFNPKDYYLLQDCTRFCFMEKRLITNIGDDLIIINGMNNYFYHINKENENIKDKYYKISLIKTFEIIFNDFVSSYDSINNLTNINYIKTNLLNLFRTVTYVIILNYYMVNSSNTQIIEFNLNNNYDQIIDSLKVLGLNYLLELTEKFYKFADDKLKPL